MLLVDSNYFKSFITKYGLLPFIDRLVLQLEQDFQNWSKFTKSPRHAVHVERGVMELMPCSDGEYYSFKYVNGHPANTKDGLLNIVGLGVLADANTGMPCMMSEMTWLTAIRTACTSALVAKYGALDTAKSIGIIGCGSQSEFQILAVNQVRPCENIFYYDIDSNAMKKFAKNITSEKFQLHACESASDVAKFSDILITNTGFKGQQTVVSEVDIKPGQLIIAIGGDCPGKTELSIDLLHAVDEIWVELLEQTKVEGEIQQISDYSKVVQIEKILQADFKRPKNSVILFDGVGFALEDFSALKLLFNLIKQDNVPFHNIAPIIKDPKNLFGVLYE